MQMIRTLSLLTGLFLTGVGSLLAQEGVDSVASDKIQKFQEQDPFGVSMAIIAMGVVFCALLILFLCFKWSGKVLNKGVRSSLGLKKTQTVKTVQVQRVVDTVTGQPAADEVAAAIGVALFLHADGMHDHESEELTLVSAPSAWTGSGANHKQNPLRKF
jgi:Na+-transporting methylmalonyl-CoA/oxaloacetate decarboxylase gamma subunit